MDVQRVAAAAGLLGVVVWTGFVLFAGLPWWYAGGAVAVVVLGVVGGKLDMSTVNVSTGTSMPDAGEAFEEANDYLGGQPNMPQFSYDDRSKYESATRPLKKGLTGLGKTSVVTAFVGEFTNGSTGAVVWDSTYKSTWGEFVDLDEANLDLRRAARKAIQDIIDDLRSQQPDASVRRDDGTRVYVQGAGGLPEPPKNGSERSDGV